MSITSFWRLSTPPTDILTQQTSQHPEYADLDPKDMHRGQFEQLTRAEQIAYIEKWGTGPNKEVTIQSASALAHGGTTVRLSLKTDAGGVKQVVGSVDDRVLDPTKGQDHRPPYLELPGSPTGGALSKAGADALFPKLNGLENKELADGRPPEMDQAPPPPNSSNAVNAAFLNKFLTWHSAHQVEYIRTKGTNNALQLTDPSGTIVYAAVISTTTGKIYNIQSLAKQDIAVIPEDDLKMLSAFPAFAAQLRDLGLSPTGSADSLITAALDRMTLVNALWSGDKLPHGASLPTAAAHYAQPFREQIEILRDRVAKKVVDVNTVKAEIQEIEKRFDRLKAYYESVHVEIQQSGISYGGSTIQRPVISLDEDRAIQAGLAIFFEQEQKIAASLKRRQSIADGHGTLAASLANGVRLQTGPGGKALDLPTLIYMLQNEYNIQKEAEVASDTEAVRQMNELLKSYTLFQNAINTTIGGFSKDDMDKQNKRGLLHKDKISGDLATDKNAIVWTMFNNRDHFHKGHPMEKLSGNPRPLMDLYGVDTRFDMGTLSWITDVYATGHTPNTWQQFQTSLSERVNSLNQDSQVRMNEINNKDKERNRHFDQANNALQKMNDALQNILRAG